MALLKEIQEWNRQGLIPGADETEKEFINRAQFCLELKSFLFARLEGPFPFEETEQASQEVLQEVYPQIETLYGMAPTWVPLFFSNYQLAPWHGGCAWIFQLSEETPLSAFLQLRAQFHNHSSYLGLYQRKELIAHELSHVGRMAYQEPQFEEILAYQSASSAWRRWLGPLFQSSKETLFFILILGALFLAEMALISLEYASLSSWWMPALMLAPLALLTLALGRLTRRQWLFQHALKNLEMFYQDERIAQAVIYRLLDREISSFASFSPEQICKWMKQESDRSFRWHFILQNYPIPNNFC